MTLLDVPGASGVADSFRPVATHLAAHHTVVLYDGRGFSRSTLDRPQDYTRRLQTDTDDVRLIEHVGSAPATVFGASSGESLSSSCSPVTRTWWTCCAVRTTGSAAAARWAEMGGIGPAVQKFREHAFPEVNRHIVAQAPKNEANAFYWFEHELRQYPPIQLDLETLTARAGRIVMAVGREACGYPALVVKRRSGRKPGRNVIELPGGHVGCMAHPAEFAHELTQTITQMQTDRH